MIGGATRGPGGAALGHHLAADEARPGASRGLVAEGIHDQVAELTALGEHARTCTPLYHVHADPPADRPWSPDERAEYWTRFEREFGLEDRPFAATIHGGHDREHEHRVYLRVNPDGTAIRLDHDHARREKLHRLFEFDRGEAFVPGAHNRAVLHALDREGRADVVAAMRKAGLDQVDRPRASMTPSERAQVERTEVSKENVRSAALAAWRSSDGGPAFEAALAERGLRLAQGEKTVQIVDLTGGTHDLRRSLAQAAKGEGAAPVKAVDVTARISGLALPTVDDARQTVADAPVLQPPLPDPVAPSVLAGVSETTIPPTSEPAEAPKENNEHVPRSPRPAHVDRGAEADVSFGDADPGDEAIDWSRPDAWDRWVRQQQARARKESAKGRAAVAAVQVSSRQHGGHDGKHADEFAETVRELFHRPTAKAPNLDGQLGRGTDRRDDGRRAPEVAPDVHRQPRHEPVDLRHPQDRSDDAGPDGAAGASRSPGGEGTDATRDRGRAPRGDVRGDRQDRAAAGRARIEARRMERGLAAAVETHGDRLAELTAQLRQPPNILSLAYQALNAADQRTHAVLADEPRPLDARRLAGEFRDRVHEDARMRDRAAEAAAEQLKEAEARLGFLDRIAEWLGIRTTAIHDRDVAAQEADRAKAARLDRRDVDDRIAVADRRVRYDVEVRQREREAFERRPDVQQSRCEAHGNRLVRAAIAGGDKQVTTLAVHELTAARAELLWREEEVRLQLEAEAREREAGTPAPALGPQRR